MLRWGWPFPSQWANFSGVALVTTLKTEASHYKILMTNMDSIQKHLHIRMPAACPQSESSKFPSFPETKLANLTEEFLPLSCNFASSAEPKEMGRPEWEEINNREGDGDGYRGCGRDRESGWWPAAPAAQFQRHTRNYFGTRGRESHDEALWPH